MKVLIDNGHGNNTKGKCSPDKRFLEWKYTREIANEVVNRLYIKGIDAELLVPEERDVRLDVRCNRVNKICYEYGKQNVLLVSIHNDAIGTDGKWHDCGGWSAYTSKGETKSDAAARCLYFAADKYLADYITDFVANKEKGLYGKKQKPIRTDFSDGDIDKEANFTILYNTLCPAVLTENLFQDNKLDVDFLLSKEGREAIINLHVEGIINYVNLSKPKKK